MKLWARMIVAPWWARWLAGAAIAAVALTAISAVAFPTFFARLGSLPGALALLGFSLAAAAPVTLVQTPVLRSYAPALTGLNLQERTQVLAALRTGQIPPDPRVLAAAVRAGNISLAHRRRTARWQKSARWWVPGTYIVLAVLAFLSSNPRQGLLWVGFGVFFGVYSARQSARSRRLPGHVERLRAADASAATDTEDSVALPPRRMKTAMLLTIVVAIGFGVAVYLWGTPRQTSDCRTADKAVGFIYTHPKMLNARLITPGDPALSSYQGWSDQLQEYARQVTAPDISRHLHRIAELSAHAVSLVQDVRKDPAGSLPEDVISDNETAYRSMIDDLITEDRDLIPICHAHN